MAIHKCKICSVEFYSKPSHEKRGWGIFCSRECKNIGTSKKIEVRCYVCNKLIYKTESQMKRSKSGKYFCGKSCQAKWRNVEYGGNKHSGWKGGQSIYRKLMINAGFLPKCVMCGKVDLRILAVHHTDENHLNNAIENLAWLCHNCHYLVHHDKLEKQRFLKFKT